MNNLNKRIKYLITPYKNGLTKASKKDILKRANIEEKKYCCNLINIEPSCMWSGTFGEETFKDFVESKNIKIYKPKIIKCCKPDFETDNYIYEIKNRNWTTQGTAGEKILGTMYKYSDVPLYYNKPLRIICMGYTEWELTHKSYAIFGNISDRKKEFLKLAKSFKIEYILFSDFIKLDKI